MIRPLLLVALLSSLTSCVTLHSVSGAHPKNLDSTRFQRVEISEYGFLHLTVPNPSDLEGEALRRLGEKDDEPTVNQLVSFYDGEQNVQIRMSLLRAFGDSKQKSAVRKLMTIARNDPSVELRKAAVRYLGESKDPEALKFLEDLLK